MFPLMPQEQLHRVINHVHKDTTECDMPRLFQDFKDMGFDPDLAIALAEVFTRPPLLLEPLQYFTAEYIRDRVCNGNGGYYGLARHIKEKLGCADEPMSAAEISSCLHISGWYAVADILNERIHRMIQEGRVYYDRAG